MLSLPKNWLLCFFKSQWKRIPDHETKEIIFIRNSSVFISTKWHFIIKALISFHSIRSCCECSCRMSWKRKKKNNEINLRDIFVNYKFEAHTLRKSVRSARRMDWRWSWRIPDEYCGKSFLSRSPGMRNLASRPRGWIWFLCLSCSRSCR